MLFCFLIIFSFTIVHEVTHIVVMSYYDCELSGVGVNLVGFYVQSTCTHTPLERLSYLESQSMVDIVGYQLELFGVLVCVLLFALIIRDKR